MFLVRCEVCLVRHGVCHFCPYLSCLAASRMGLVIAETGNRREERGSQGRHIWPGEGRGGAGLVMAETGNRREDWIYTTGHCTADCDDRGLLVPVHGGGHVGPACGGSCQLFLHLLYIIVNSQYQSISLNSQFMPGCPLHSKLLFNSKL